jgi:hypothetical protein
MLKPISIASAIALAATTSVRAETANEKGANVTRFAAEGRAGVGTPLGDLGVEVNAAVTPWLTVSAGIGTDFTLVAGPGTGRVDMDTQLGAMARGHLPVSRMLEIGAGLGLSMGGYANYDVPLVIGGDDTQTWANAKWANTEVYVQTRGALYVRAFVGASALLNPDECVNYRGEACMQSAPVGRIYGGGGVGYRF